MTVLTQTQTQESDATNDADTRTQGASQTPPSTEAQKKEPLTRDYIVLRRINAEEGVEKQYEEVGEFNASSDRNAVKDAMAKLGVEAGSFRAIASSSWHEHTKTVKVVEEARWS